MYFYRNDFFYENILSTKDKIGIIPNAVQPGIFLFISELKYDNYYFSKKRINSFNIGD